eukprot:TRINITY_DN27385_c0_g1_i1.p1 TRINITY_DN27385_c0_g1~~TRINITY_DN27385_c0_g1_i1.p1  ORF type:complete len:407 (-),score=81.30 TRINITY_DN27385_c0_g1_i1:90-1280(-)
MPPKKHFRSLQSTAESWSEEALKSGNISENTVLEALRLFGVPNGKGRQTVNPKGFARVPTVVLGLYAYGNKVELTSKTRAYPHTTRLLAAYAQKYRPGFPFTSINVNVNWAARPHVDKGNLGSSLITALGNFKKGELFYEDENGDTESLRLAEDVGGRYRKGSTVRGYNVQIKGRWLTFDGNKLHYANKFSGDRCSLVYYTCSRYGEAHPEVRMDLGDAGFHSVMQLDTRGAPMDGSSSSIERKKRSHAVQKATTDPSNNLKRMRHGPSAPRQQEGDAMEKVRKATLSLIYDVDSNKKQGGGTKDYRDNMAALRRKLKGLPSNLAEQVEVLLSAADSKFVSKTCASWKIFLPPVLQFLKTESGVVAEAKVKADPKGAMEMQPVYAATAKAKRMRCS